MKYIVYKRFKEDNTISKIPVNLPYGTICEGGIIIPPDKKDIDITQLLPIIIYNLIPLCVRRSLNGIEHFCRHDDNNGLIRGDLITSIKKHLTPRDCTASDYPYYSKLTEHDIEELNAGHATERVERWARIWNSDLCHKYKRDDQGDYWLWHEDFYDAPIYDLVYIADVCKLKVPELYRLIAKDEKLKIYF